MCMTWLCYQHIHTRRFMLVLPDKPERQPCRHRSFSCIHGKYIIPPPNTCIYCCRRHKCGGNSGTSPHMLGDTSYDAVRSEDREYVVHSAKVVEAGALCELPTITIRAATIRSCIFQGGLMTGTSVGTTKYLCDWATTCLRAPHIRSPCRCESHNCEIAYRPSVESPVSVITY